MYCNLSVVCVHELLERLLGLSTNLGDHMPSGDISRRRGRIYDSHIRCAHCQDPK
jgi:hypothetical protein